ncbi:MAG: ABC transporter ATP-binding protein [Fibrobacteraceae bacterium]|nr:ABC transporter ATP-binding protein [Fibrobacteraceae bacterium]
MSAKILEVDHLSLHYLTRFGEKINAVTDVSFSMKQGEILGIAGESGCGKSTLVSGLMGMCIPPLYPTSGDVRVNGESLMNRTVEDIRANVLAQKISMIPQGAFNALNPVRKVKDIAADVIAAHQKSGSSVSPKEIYERLCERFDLFGMDTKRVLNSFPNQLTAGERQRSVIGISTLLNPQMVIADEPTSALDVSTQKEVIRMIFDLLDKGIFSTMIFITHELPLLYHVADNIAIMYAGEFVEMGSAEQVVKDPRHPYTKALMNAMLSTEQSQRTRKPEAIEGAPPSLKQTIVGCRFAERCKVACPDCKKNTQLIRMVGDRLVRCDYAK